MNALSNMQPQIDALNDKLRELGRESVKSGLAKPQMAMAIIAAAQVGIIDEADAEAKYAEYMQGRSYAIGRNSLAAGMEDKANSIASNTSKVRSHIKAAMLPTVNFAHVVSVLVEMRAKMKASGVDVKDPYQAITDAAVQQCRQPNDELDDAALEGIITKKAKEEKDELAKITDEYKRLYKLALGTEETPGIEAMIPVFESICDVLDGMGVARPAMTAEEKKAEKAMSFLKSTGRI
jgi:hypothetical protein